MFFLLNSCCELRVTCFEFFKFVFLSCWLLVILCGFEYLRSLEVNLK